jgi:hypothetical protein
MLKIYPILVGIADINRREHEICNTVQSQAGFSDTDWRSIMSYISRIIFRTFVYRLLFKLINALITDTASISVEMKL